ncbi:MAG: tetrahydromethanopterin S-methyltransferase subunit H [Chloroflexi bacterium]|nr:tetrahydromethanopterin S-methyltransferase subunit H [Chloroflexota bacterium]
MFLFETEQNVATIGGIRIGGQPGENATVLIGSMFHKGDRLIESRRERKFDRAKATDYIRRQEELSSQTGIPCLMDIVANSGEEFKAYIDFFAHTTDMPFATDAWNAAPKLAAARYVSELGLTDRFVYNSITPWGKDNEEEVATIAGLGVKNIMLCAFDNDDPTPAGRVRSTESLLAVAKKGNFENVLVDTTVLNLPSTSFSLLANYEIKTRFGLPVGCAAANATYAWKEAREKWDTLGFAGLDAATHGIAALLWSDFLFYGPAVNARWVFPAVAAADLMLSTMYYHESGALPTDPGHPLHRLFPDFAGKLAKRGGD